MSEEEVKEEKKETEVKKKEPEKVRVDRVSGIRRLNGKTFVLVRLDNKVKKMPIAIDDKIYKTYSVTEEEFKNFDN